MRTPLWSGQGVCLWLSLLACLAWSPRSEAAAPVITAGPNQTLPFPANQTTLFGRATDADNDPLSITWSRTSGPATVAFTSTDALHTTVTFTATGTYVFQLAVSDGGTPVTSSVTVVVTPAASQTAFYVDPTYTGSTETGAPATPWKSLADGDGTQAARWATINSALASNDVILYFSARTAGTDTAEETTGTLRIIRSDTSTHRLTLDGMSKYNTNDASPSWADYTGTQKFRIRKTSGFLALGEDDHVKFNYTIIRGFEVTGSGARILIGGSFLTMEYVWSHDITDFGAQFALDAAVTPNPGCVDIGKDQAIALRNNTFERGQGEGMYIAGNYMSVGDGGCPAYGNAHTDILIEGNTLSQVDYNHFGDSQGDAIDLKAGLQNVTIRNNLIDTTHAGPGDDGATAIVTSGTFSAVPTNYLFEGNRMIRTWGSGIQMGNLHGAIVRNNVITLAGRGGVLGYGITMGPGATAETYNSHVEISNNTIYNNPGYGLVLGGLSGPLTLRNNIVVANGFGGSIWDASGGSWTADYNLWAPTGPDFGEGAHGIVQGSTSGIFVNPGGLDFHLTPTSPALNAGVDLSVLANVGPGGQRFRTDMAGLTRPQGTAWDMGPLEGDGPAACPPTNLVLVPPYRTTHFLTMP